jgi:hypothetical protein
MHQILDAYIKVGSNIEIQNIGCVSIIKVAKQHGNLQVKNQHRFVVCSCELVVFLEHLDCGYNISCLHESGWPTKSSFFSIILKQQKQLLGMREGDKP